VRGALREREGVLEADDGSDDGSDDGRRAKPPTTEEVTDTDSHNYLHIIMN